MQDTVQEGLELTFDGNFDTSCPSGDRLRLGCELRDRSFFELILSIEKSDLATITRDITYDSPVTNLFVYHRIL